MERTQEEYSQLIEKSLKEAGAKIAFKDESKILKLCNLIVWFFNKRFMTSYVNVIGSTIWFPSKKSYEEAEKKWLYCFLKHELHHVVSTKKKTIPGMILYYGFPQSLSILTLIALIVCGIVLGFKSLPVLILGILTILFALPWPAYFRVQEEVCAEVDSELTRIEEGYVSAKDSLFNNVCSFEYYNPMFRKTWARKMFEKELNKRLDGE